MDSTYQSKSFGLLDENLLNDLTLNNPKLTNNNKNAVIQKPPIPNGGATKKKSIGEYTPLINDLMNGDEADETQVSIRLNATDFNQLGVDDLTNDFNDDDEDDNETEEQDRTLDNNNQNIQSNYNNNNPFDTLLLRQDRCNDLLLNESSDILRNSNEYSNEFSKTNIINYDAMDALNNITNSNTTTTTNTTTNNVNDNLDDDPMINCTINEADVDKASRLQDFIMRSVERFKRQNNILCENDILNSSSKNNMNNKENNDDKRFSVSTVRTTYSSHINQSNLDDISNMTQNQTISYELNHQNPVSTPLLTRHNEKEEESVSIQSMSIYFKPQTGLNDESKVNNSIQHQKLEDNEITFQQQQQAASFIFDKVQDNGADLSMFATTNGGSSSNKISDFNPFSGETGQLNSKDMNLTDSDFKPGNECLSELIKAEVQNRKEFTNELSVLASSNSDESKITNEACNETTNSSSSSSPTKKDKWWKKSSQEVEAQSNRLEQSKAQEYFESNSSFPSFLANKDPEMNYSMLKNFKKPEKEQQDETICEQNKANNKITDPIIDLTLSTTKNYASTSNGSSSSASFSFTINASENGDPVIFKQNSETTTPFQAARSVTLYQQKKQAAATAAQTTINSSNLKIIGEELDRVSNRLAEQNDTSTSSKSKTTTITTAITTLTTTKSEILNTEKPRHRYHHNNNNNNQLIITMDETMSSINSSSNRTTSSNLACKKQSKPIQSKGNGGPVAGSLTSTPSKLNKKSTSVDTSSENKSNFLTQDSFMSSIPESKHTNDSTLVGNHHHYYNSANGKKIINNSKNAEIQTSPDSKSTSSSSSITPTTSFESASSNQIDQATAAAAATIAKPITASNMVAINNLAASLLATTTTTTTNPNETNRTSLFNNSNNNNGLIPVAFMPIEYVMNLRQSSSGSGAAGLFSSMSSVADYSSTSSSSSSTSLRYKYEMPQLELNKTCIDFGQIAEGCHDTCRLFAKLANTNLIQQNRELSVLSHLQIEIDNDFQIERLNPKTKRVTKLDNDTSVMPKLCQTLGIQLDKQQVEYLKPNLKIEFVTNYYEFYVHLNTIDLDYFKEIIYQSDSSSSDDCCMAEQPLAIKTNLSIYYYYIENNCQRKFLLNQIEIKFMLGYARLRSSSDNINLIEFDLLSILHNNNNSIRSNRTNYIDDNDNDKTLNYSSKNESMNTSNKSQMNNSIENSIQLSNAGNIPINVDCYLIDLNENENSKMKLLNLKNKHYQLRVDKSIINLEAKTNANKKQIARLILTKLIDSTNAVTTTTFDDLNIRLIFQVMPNGFKYEIPVKLTMNPNRLKKTQSLDTTSSSIGKIVSSKSILFFGRTLASHNMKSATSASETAGLINEFVIKNINEYKLKYDISVSTCLLNNESSSSSQSCYDELIDMSTNSTISSISKASVNLFKFTPDMKEKSVKEISSLTRLIVELEPGQEILIRIQFNASLVESDKSNQLLNVYGIVQLKSISGVYNQHQQQQQRSNIYLVGFLNRSQLYIDSNQNKLVKLTDLSSNQDCFKFDRQICNKNLQLFSHEYQLVPVWTDSECNFSFKKSIKLCNRSNSKMIIYLVFYDCKVNCEIETTNSDHEYDDNVILYDLGSQILNGFTSRLKLRLERNKLNRLNNILWFELSPNETDSIQIDFDFKLNNSAINRKKLIDFFEKNEKKLNQFSINLFWIESEINLQCLNGAQLFKDNSMLKNNINYNSTFIDTFLKKLLTPNHNNMHSNGLFINSIITKKVKLQYDTIMSLMSQALKCTSLKLSILFKFVNNNNNNSFNFTASNSFLTDQNHQTSSSFLLNDSASNSICQIPTNTTTTAKDNDDTWSIVNNSIIINNVKFGSNTTNCFSSKITIKNHLVNKELPFNIAFNSACLDIHPSRGLIGPLQSLDVIVRVRRAIANKSGLIERNSWYSLISVICNKVEKDVKVHVYGPPSPVPTSDNTNSSSINNRSISLNQSRSNKLSSTSSNSSSSSKLYKALPPLEPIQSSSLPVPSVNNKKMLSLESVTASTSSLSIADSYLEQGTLISDTSTSCIDSFSLTPVMQASFQMTATKNTNDDDNDDDTIIKVLHCNNNAQIKFPSVCTHKSKSYDFTLINPTNSFVTWKAQTHKHSSMMPPPHNLLTSRSTSYGVFKLTPSTGVIQANQKQIIRIEFCPREEQGNFQEIWEIETKNSMPTAYSCKLVITGKSISNHDNNNALSDYNSQQRIHKSIHSHNPLPKLKLKENTKENNDPFFGSNKTNNSEYDQTIGSNKTNADFDYSSINNRKIIIKTELIEFADTCPGAKSKSFILIDNKEEKKCSLNIISLIEPFYCKHPSIDIQPKHYVKVPIEFKPFTKGEYRDKVLIRIEGNEMPLSCVVKGKCI